MTKNTNGEFLNVLQNYEGTVDDRRKKFLVENYGFSDDRSVVTMEHEVLGDLGYTGSIDDRWSKYLKALGGTGLSAKASLLSSTFYLGYSVGGVAPNFVSDFEKDNYLVDKSFETFDDALTFTRSGSATYVDSTGTLQTAADGEPRTGHHIWNGSEWVNEGLLIESESRTNLVTHSEDFADASWGKVSGTTVLTNQDVSPDGAITGSRIEGSGSIGGQHLTFSQLSLADDTVYTLSAFFLHVPGGFSSVRLGLTGKDGITRRGSVDLSDGTLLSDVGVLFHSYEDFTGGWKRISISLSSSSGGSSPVFRIYGADASGNPFVEAEGLQVGVWGAQVEAALTPSSYIPTAGSTVTRAAETLTAPSANLPWSSSAVSIAMEGTMTYADEGGISIRFFDWDLSPGRITDYVTTSSSNEGRCSFFQEDDSSNQYLVTDAFPGSYSPGVNVPFSIASRHGATFINGAVDGTALTANTTPTALPDLSSTDLDIAPDFMGTIKSLRIWSDDLGDSGIEEASS